MCGSKVGKDDFSGLKCCYVMSLMLHRKWTKSLHYSSRLDEYAFVPVRPPLLKIPQDTYLMCIRFLLENKMLQQCFNPFVERSLKYLGIVSFSPRRLFDPRGPSAD